jgi:hypothetical protein
MIMQVTERASGMGAVTTRSPAFGLQNESDRPFLTVPVKAEPWRPKTQEDDHANSLSSPTGFFPI